MASSLCIIEMSLCYYALGAGASSGWSMCGYAVDYMAECRINGTVSIPSQSIYELQTLIRINSNANERKSNQSVRSKGLRITP